MQLELELEVMSDVDDDVETTRLFARAEVPESGEVLGVEFRTQISAKSTRVPRSRHTAFIELYSIYHLADMDTWHTDTHRQALPSRLVTLPLYIH
jgi:hypothetical protein